MLKISGNISFSREISLKTLRIECKKRKILTDSNFFSKSHRNSIKSLLFLYDFQNFVRKTPPNIQQKNLTETIESLRKTLNFQDNPNFTQLIQLKLDEISMLNLETGYFNEKQRNLMPLEYNLIPIILWSSLINEGYPVIASDIIFWIKNGKIPYLKGIESLLEEKIRFL